MLDERILACTLILDFIALRPTVSVQPSRVLGRMATWAAKVGIMSLRTQ